MGPVTAGWGCLNIPPAFTRLLGHVAICGKRHSKECLKSVLGHFLGQVKGQVTRGRQMSNLAFYNVFDKLARNSETSGVAAPQKSTFDSYSNALAVLNSNIFPKINSLASRAQKV